MNRAESLPQRTVEMGLPISNLEAERVASIAAVLNYLIEDSAITVKPNYQVLDLGTGSGAGIFAWRAFGIQDENITGVDRGGPTIWPFNSFLLGAAEHVSADVNKYIEGSVGQVKFDIISAFLIPQFEHDYTRNGYGDRAQWLRNINGLLRDKDSFYIETMLESYRLPQAGGWEYDASSPFQTSYYSFMGDELPVPDLPLLKPTIPRSINMGISEDSIVETTYLDGQKWIPCNPTTGKPMPIIRRYYSHCKSQFDDEYGAEVEYVNGRKLYPFGKIKMPGYSYGYRDNIAALHKKTSV